MNYYYIDEPVKNKKRPPGKNFFTIILITLVIMLIGDIVTGIPAALISRSIEDGGWRFLLENYMPFLGSFILIFVYLAYFDRDIFRTTWSASHGGMKRNTLKWILFGLLAGVVMNSLCALIAYIHGDLDFSFGQFDPVYMIAALIIVCIQSSSEELLMRCYVFQAMNRRYGLIAAIVGNSLFFALLHGSNPGIGPIPILCLLAWSVACSLIVYYFDGLWFVMMVHTAWNYTQNFLLGLPNSGLVTERSLLHLDMASGSIFYDTAFGLEGGITAFLEYAVISVIIIVLMRGRKRASANADLQQTENEY